MDSMKRFMNGKKMKILTIAFTYGVVIFCCFITGCGIPEPYEVSQGVYSISKQDYAGAFGNAQKMKADVIRKANSFATKQGMVAVPAGLSFTPLGGGQRWRAETEPVRSLVFGRSLGYNQNQQRHETEEKKPQCGVQSADRA